MDTLHMQQMPPQPMPGDLPKTPLYPEAPSEPITDPTQDPPPPIEDPDVVDPTSAPDAPMIARAE